MPLLNELRAAALSGSDDRVAIARPDRVAHIDYAVMHARSATVISELALSALGNISQRVAARGSLRD